MKHYLEYQDSKSYKFWQAEIEASTLTVKYGKIGTAGQEKITTFDSPEKAQKEMAKLVAEKTKKGYVEKGAASAKKITRRLAVSYDEAEEGKTLLEKVTAFVESAQAAEVEALVIGSWDEPFENSPQDALDLLAQNRDKLGQLKELFVGDMDSEECEISWIMQGDYTGIFTAFPQLERLHIKGSTELILSSTPLKHDHLQSITIECGGLPKQVIATIAKAQLPNLNHLRIFLGVADYGFDGAMDDLRPFMQAGLFPKLTYLGLVDSDIADQIALEIANAPVLAQLETLDLSLGTLSDEGARALLDSSAIKKLKKLDLHYHFLSGEMVKEFKKMATQSAMQVDVTQQQTPEDGEEDEDDVWRYPAVTE